VFGTDQTGTDPRFVEFARGADLLVLHMTVGVGVKSPLHAAPDVVGRIARDAKPARLILSHLDPGNLDEAVAEVKKQYTGPMTIGADLQCTPVPSLGCTHAGWRPRNAPRADDPNQARSHVTPRASEFAEALSQLDLGSLGIGQVRGPDAVLYAIRTDSFTRFASSWVQKAARSLTSNPM
jgi:hypothetical protein